MIKQLCIAILLIFATCGVARAAVVFSILADSGQAGQNSAQIPAQFFDYDGVSQVQNIPGTPAIFRIPSLTPMVKSETEFEIVIDYFDGGLQQTITRGQANVGLQFTSLEVGNGSGVFKTLTLANADPFRTPPADLYRWDNSARLLSGSAFGAPFVTSQSADRTASLRATYSVAAGENLLTFNPTELRFTANWFVNDGNGQVNFKISSVPEPSSLTIFGGALFGLCLFGRDQRTRSNTQWV